MENQRALVFKLRRELEEVNKAMLVLEQVNLHLFFGLNHFLRNNSFPRNKPKCSIHLLCNKDFVAIKKTWATKINGQVIFA
jgi:hypothetical protein